MEIRLLHDALMRPDTYLSDDGPVEYAETHVSRLYFTTRHVYKIKKPVDLGFLNFTTLDRRRFYCEEEVRLNRRFAPDTYLGVCDVRRDAKGITLGGPGETVEYAVKMNRLPGDRMLDTLLANKDPALPAAMGGVGRRLGRLHLDSEICRNDGGQSNLEIVRYNWKENISQSRVFAGRTLSEGLIDLVAVYVENFLRENEPLLRQREALGWIRDGHGDLHSEHICLTDPLRIYDCIEFNRRFRVADVAADLGFLLMDLEFRGRRDLAALLLEAYRQEIGEPGDMESLLPFYKIYRAWVRGKVESFLCADEGADLKIRESAGRRGQRYFSLAAGYLCPPVQILTCGLMGTGKSTLSRALSNLLGADLLRSDEIRKELAGPQASAGATAPYGQGLYTPEFTRRTYGEMLDRTRTSLKGRGRVIVDASFSKMEDRERFREEAAAHGIPTVLLLTHCTRETALERLARRQKKKADPSDGRPELYDQQKNSFESPGGEAILVDTSQEHDYTFQSAVVAILEQLGRSR